MSEVTFTISNHSTEESVQVIITSLNNATLTVAGAGMFSEAYLPNKKYAICLAPLSNTQVDK